MQKVSNKEENNLFSLSTSQMLIQMSEELSDSCDSEAPNWITSVVAGSVSLKV